MGYLYFTLFTGLSEAHWLLPDYTATRLHCRPEPPTSADHWIASPDSPDIPWLVPPSGLARPGKYPGNLTHLAQDTTPLVDDIDLLESLASMLFAQLPFT